jgi:hypothetical protein
MLLSLHGEILARMGRAQEAREAARTAYDQARVGLHRDTLLRAHFDVIAERLARLLREASETAEAAHVEEALAEWPRAQAVSGLLGPPAAPP